MTGGGQGGPGRFAAGKISERPEWGAGMVGCDECEVFAWALTAEGETDWTVLADWWLGHVFHIHGDAPDDVPVTLR